jgi:hypothetical protein
MSRGPRTFRQRDAEALIRAARAAGLEIERVEVGRDGKIVLVTRRPGGEIETVTKEANEWDEVMRR